ncbi:GNAT family N-acetyltransferase [Pseudomonas sp. MONT-RG-20F-20-E-7-02]|uniref:GNAT family N-acetyltransferase n=1 Tax=Pseudomonas sp. MONT-RG-20F-20-E-7-02 TaxID=2914979 RepID=UPI001F58ACF2|nr:GNAT family N-acetyltransferase [Pseudomonas sp. MONT-RG-20F-20-E-7-02]
MITVMAETLAERLEELKPMFPLHFAELALNQDKVPLDPQYEIYLERERRGEVMFHVVREEGQIIGYFVGFVAPGLHYQTCLTLILDIFWIHPGHRGNAAGYKLFKSVEADAKARGVQRMFVGSKVHLDASWLFERLGYEKVETYYSTWLGD